MRRITVEELEQMAPDSRVVVDIRPEELFRKGKEPSLFAITTKI